MWWVGKKNWNGRKDFGGRGNGGTVSERGAGVGSPLASHYRKEINSFGTSLAIFLDVLACGIGDRRGP